MAHRIAELFDSRLPYFKGARQLRNNLTGLLAPALVPPQTIFTRYGFRMVITSADDAIDYNLYTRGTYEAGTLHIINSCLREGDVFIDVGANIGLMSLVGSMRVGQNGAVYAFEPEPATFTLLQHNISINQLQNIHAVNLGLSSARGVEVIYQSRSDNRGMASFIANGFQATRGTEVAVCTLDEFLAENEIDSVRMIKIDVEGWESEVMKGASSLIRKSNAPILCIEYNNRLPSHRNTYELIMSSNSYQAFMLPHGNWHVSRLVPVTSINTLPATNSVNLYYFLPVHLKTIAGAIFHNG